MAKFWFLFALTFLVENSEQQSQQEQLTAYINLLEIDELFLNASFALFENRYIEYAVDDLIIYPYSKKHLYQEVNFDKKFAEIKNALSTAKVYANTLNNSAVVGCVSKASKSFDSILEAGKNADNTYMCQTELRRIYLFGVRAASRFNELSSKLNSIRRISCSLDYTGLANAKACYDRVASELKNYNEETLKEVEDLWTKFNTLERDSYVCHRPANASTLRALEIVLNKMVDCGKQLNVLLLSPNVTNSIRKSVSEVYSFIYDANLVIKSPYISSNASVNVDKAGVNAGIQEALQKTKSHIDYVERIVRNSPTNDKWDCLNKARTEYNNLLPKLEIEIFYFNVCPYFYGRAVNYFKDLVTDEIIQFLNVSANKCLEDEENLTGKLILDDLASCLCLAS